MSRGLASGPSQSWDENQSHSSKNGSFPSVQILQRELSSLLGFGANRLIDSKSYGESALEQIEPTVAPIEYDENAYWRDLPKQVQAAAGILGYTEEIWDDDEEPSSSERRWDKLSPEEQRAAQVLGYNQVRWDEDDCSSTSS
jgi:hypothetical protein